MTDLWWLEPGEKLLWSDHPDLWRYLRLRLGDWPWGIPVLLGVAILFYFGASSELFSFFVVGCAAVLVFILVKLVWVRGRTFYAITDRRAVIDVNVESRSIPLRGVRSIRVKASRNGAGEIVFNEKLMDDGETTWVTEEGFIAIRNVAQVERLLHEAIDRATSQSGRDGA
jgi:hypothetical protein